MTWAGHVACTRDEKCIQNFGQEGEGKMPLGKPRINDSIIY